MTPLQKRKALEKNPSGKNPSETMKNKKVTDDISLSFYRTPKAKVIYIKSKDFKPGHCNVCGKKRKTTAHHLVPKRLRCVFPDLSELRIRVCDECDESFHPENRLIKVSDVVQKQNRTIEYLHNEIYWRSMKLNQIQQQMNLFEKKTIEMETLKIDTLGNLFTINKMHDKDFYRKPAKV